MRTRKNHAFLALLGVFALAACDDVGTETLLDDLTLQEQAELAVLSDPGSFEVALELTEASNDAAAGLGMMEVASGRMFNAQARSRFVEARQAMLAGEHRRALDAARQARLLVARALAALGGDASLEALIERIEELALTAEDDVFDDADAVRAELEAIAAEARELLAEGDTLAAAAWAILGEQIARRHRGRRDRPDIQVDRARLSVALAGSAVALAERLIADGTVPPATDRVTDVASHQNRWLGHAKRLLAMAEQALGEGNLRRAVHLAHHAQWSALKAVILPGGVNDEEIRAMADLAQSLYEQAEAALGQEATDLELRLLNHARELIELGLERLEAGQARGVAALWRAAVVCHWLLG